MEEVKAKWGMVIDLDRCNGCQACVTACAMENNIPYVGEDEAAYGRSMQWIRIERYWEGEYPNVMARYRPVLCQQCGRAPCESVCPVFASYHSEAQQVNGQVYNRCIGTRYCGNNCPYIARQFNWFDFSQDMPEPLNWQFNPDVTVRRRGVMEKCTFCIQRLNGAEEQARRENIPPNEVEVQPACAQACPSEVFVFGLLSDPESRVSRMARSARAYRLLEDMGTEPRIIYLSGGGGGERTQQP